MRALMLAALCGSFTAVHAEQAKGPFVGFSVGSFRYTERASAVGAKISDTTDIRRLVGGYRFTERLSIEAGWGTSGDIRSSVVIDDPVLGPAVFQTDGDFDVVTVRAVGVLPLKRFSLFGGVGLYEGELAESGRYEDELGLATYSYEEEDGGVNLVGGLQFDFRRMTLRAEYEWFDADVLGVDRNVSTWSAGCSLLFRF